MICFAGCDSQSDKTLSGSDAGKNEVWRSGSATCQIHGEKMDVVVVGDLAGPSPSFSPEYIIAKERQFPNFGVEYGPEKYGKRRGEIFICKPCETARQKWIEAAYK